MTNIKSGEEININYHPQLSMKSAQDRRSQIKKNRGFLCQCLACLVDEDGAKSQEEASKVSECVNSETKESEPSAAEQVS